MSARRRGFVCWAAGLVLVLGLAGCGASAGKVRGKVTHNGKTVVWGTVTIIGSDGVVHDGLIDLNGNYEVDKVPGGPVKIAVNSPNPDGPRSRGGKDPTPVGGKGKNAPPPPSDDPREKFLAGKEKDTGPPKPPAGAWFALPDKFGSPETSGLTGEVRGDTTINIDLK